MTKTINGLTVTTTAASGDFVPIWRAANGDTRKITKANLMGTTLTGGGSIATGGNALTVAGTSTINGSLVGNMTGGGTLATGGFTATVPATGTLALLATAQTFSALNTFSSGINLGANTLQNYVQGTWLPTIASTGTQPTVAYTTQLGNYTRIGNMVFFSFNMQITTISGGTGTIRIGGFPIAASSVFQPICAALVQSVDVPGTPISLAFTLISSSSTGYLYSAQDNANAPTWSVSSIVAGSFVQAGGFYFV